MIDAKFNLSQALPNAAANNNTAAIALLTEVPFDDKWRKGFVRVTVPALSDHTNTSVTNLITLQHSQDANLSNFANTSPLIQVQVPGVASTGSAQTIANVPLPPAVKPYIRFRQDVPANGGIGNNAVVTFNLLA